MLKKKTIEIILHILFWILTYNFYIDNAFMRVSLNNQNYEYLSLFMILVITYIDILYLVPKLFNKGSFILYFIIIFLLVLFITIIEFCSIKMEITLICSSAPKEFLNDAYQRNFLGIFVRFSLFVAFFTMFKIYKDAIYSHKLFKEKAILEKEKLLVEINVLKSRINSHFLFNTLSNIHIRSSRISPEISNMVLNLTNLLDYIVIESDKDFVPIEEEIEFIKNYLVHDKKCRVLNMNNIC